MKNPKKIHSYEEDLESLSLLGYIYEDYERPIQMLVEVTEIQSFKVEDS